MLTERRAYSGSAGSPIRLGTRADRQTEEGTRYRQSRRPRAADEEDADVWEVAKPHTSAIRYDRPVPSRRTAMLDDPKKTRLITQKRRPFFVGRMLVIVGLSLFTLALGIIALNAIGNWWQLHTDDVTYGRPRTYQTDQYVGHGDSVDHPNHFIAVNLNGVVEVVEINTQNIKLDHAYYITTTANPLNPVTLTFPTIDGKQYMYVSIGDQNSAYTVALVNDGKEFTEIPH